MFVSFSVSLLMWLPVSADSKIMLKYFVIFFILATMAVVSNNFFALLLLIAAFNISVTAMKWVRVQSCDQDCKDRTVSWDTRKCCSSEGYIPIAKCSPEAYCYRIF